MRKRRKALNLKNLKKQREDEHSIEIKINLSINFSRSYSYK